MKFYKAIALCMVLSLMALAAVGCGASDTPKESTAGTTTPTTEPTVTTTPATIPATEPTTTVAPSTEPAETVVPEELAHTYMEYAMNVPDVLGYAMADISGDGQPELIVKTGTCEADSLFHFYAWEQEEVTEIGNVSGSHSALALDENNNLIVYGGQMDSEWAYAVSYVGGIFTVSELYNRPYPEDGPTQYDNQLELAYTVE